MKRRIVCIVIGLIMLLTGTAGAATYTLPEKMQNQLAIGSGLKGSFTVKTEGELSQNPFMNAVSDAVYDLRGMASGHDLHYYLYQENNGNQTNVAELYRKEGIYYFRSDIVRDKILSLSEFSAYLDSLFSEKGENSTLSSALLNYFSLPKDIREKQWKPVFNKYQNSLEMWLHDFTAQADVVKQENGSSAFDFSYVIPIEEVKKKMISMFSEFAADTELQAMLDTIMPIELKELYLNTALSFFYQEAVNSLNIRNDMSLSKRVSALGDLISSKMILPLDPKITGYETITVESRNGYSVYQLEGTDKVIVLGLPSVDLINDPEYETSVWFSIINNDIPEKKESRNFSVRADIKKTFSQYNDEEEKSHQTEHYEIKICEDTNYLPEAHKNDELSEWHDIDAELHLHYFSKYSQNSATTLEINTAIKQNGLSVTIGGKVKTAAPWLFMPFEIKDPISIGPEHPEIVEEYRTDWISNAASMIHHTDLAETEPESTVTEKPVSESGSSAGTEIDASDTAETVPLSEKTDSGENNE